MCFIWQAIFQLLPAAQLARLALCKPLAMSAARQARIWAHVQVACPHMYMQCVTTHLNEIKIERASERKIGGREM